MTTNAELADEIEPYIVRGDNPKLTFLQWVKIIAALRQSDETERAYQMLEAYGVPRERAKSVANGIDVLATRFAKQDHFYAQALARETQAQAKIAELEERIGKTVVAMQEIINAPGGGPAKRIATLAIDAALKEQQ